MADQSGCPAESLYDGFCTAAADGHIDAWVRESGLSLSTLPIDNPGLFGGDPAVDEAVRAILGQLRDRVPNYPRKWWHRLVDVIVRFVQFIHLVRDTMPPYTLCKEDGGLGQSASESDLQEDLFASFRKDFGAAVFYERQRVGGGKPDTGLQFPDCEFPFEVKHEFQNVSRDHIRVSYLRQASDYAAAPTSVLPCDLGDASIERSGPPEESPAHEEVGRER